MAIGRNRVGQGNWFVAAIVAVAATVALGVARADDYPSRAVKIIVPSGPAGGYDFVGRAVADQLTKRLGQSVVVENRTGAGTVVGTQSVIAAPADGYTLLVGGLSNIIFNESLYKKRPYDALAQLTPVAIVNNNSYVLVAPKNSPFANVKDLVASPKAKSGEMQLAHPGVGTGQHLAGVAFMKSTGTKFLQVPYRGASAIYPDLITGRVDLFFDSTTGAMPSLKGGQVKGLGVLMAERMKDAPDVPTMKEQGLPNLAFDAWMGIFAPANTPKPVIERLQKEIAASMPDLKTRFVAAGGDIIDIEPARLDSFVRSEHDTWTKLITDAGITID
jgi:tripartite-type tricarboxylate transporter receptor subunit TctC